MKKSKKLTKFGIYSTALLGALGTGLQNFMALFDFLRNVTHLSLNMAKSLALIFGGACSGLVNLCLNIELLEDFVERLKHKKKPKLSFWQNVQYYGGCAVFITTGILFGLTAFAFGPLGALAALAVASGVLVAIIMMIQELETWLQSFDNLDETKVSQQISPWQKIKNWAAQLTLGKVIGTIVSLGNVMALSLLFTAGLVLFLTGVGVPAMPAIIASFVVAFTGGAFTEFFFYNNFLSKFCNNFKENWQKFKASDHKILGTFTILTNATVNGILCFTGILLLGTMLVAAGIAAPPLGITIVSAVMGGLASLLLGSDFWIRTSKKITNYFKKSEAVQQLEETSVVEAETVAPDLITEPNLTDLFLEETSTPAGFFGYKGPQNDDLTFSAQSPPANSADAAAMDAVFADNALRF